MEVEIGGQSFGLSKNIEIMNLNKLKTITLGKEALCGNPDKSILSMKNLPYLEALHSQGEGGSFANISIAQFDNVPQLHSIRLLGAFAEIEESNFICNSCSTDIKLLFYAKKMLGEVLSHISVLNQYSYNFKNQHWQV